MNTSLQKQKIEDMTREQLQKQPQVEVGASDPIGQVLNPLQHG